jgi:hypothetical protein
MPEKQPESEASDESQNDSIQNDSIQHDPIQHDPTGLELAQTVARSLGAQARRRRRSPSPKRVGPQMSGARADDRDPKPLSDAVERLVETKMTSWAMARSPGSRFSALTLRRGRRAGCQSAMAGALAIRMAS